MTISDGMYEAAVKEARKQGRNDGRNDGVASLMRGALRGHLSRNGYSVAELDAPDSETPPAGRKSDERKTGGNA